MARSQETFGKKDKAKKKLQKRKDKEQRKEQRQANSDKGKSLEDMLMYLDEEGNLSATPPDPKKVKVIKTEDIRISTPKYEDMEEEEVVRTGIVAFFNDAKGYGFIKDSKTGETIFVHSKGLSEPITENNKVTFEVEMGNKGPVAVKVKKTV